MKTKRLNDESQSQASRNLASLSDEQLNNDAEFVQALVAVDHAAVHPPLLAWESAGCRCAVEWNFQRQSTWGG